MTPGMSLWESRRAAQKTILKYMFLMSYTQRKTGDVMPRAEDEDDLHWLPDNRSFIYGQEQKLAPDAPVTDLRQKYRSYVQVLGRNSEDDPAIFGYGVIPSRRVKIFMRRVDRT
jgi:hypothetical protein